MCQVGKSTLMRQIIKELLDGGVDPKTILYISFDNPFIRIKYDKRRIFDIAEVYPSLQGTYKKAFVWNKQLGKVIFEDLVQVANIRKPRDLEFLFTYIIENNGKDVFYCRKFNLHNT